MPAHYSAIPLVGIPFGVVVVSENQSRAIYVTGLRSKLPSVDIESDISNGKVDLLERLIDIYKQLSVNYKGPDNSTSVFNPSSSLKGGIESVLAEIDGDHNEQPIEVISK